MSISKNSISKSLSDNKNETICGVVIIALILIVSRYVELPKSIQLLFNDRIGQVLLLLLAVFIGSYNFLCGVLLAVLFLSIMLTSKNIQEGFESEMDLEPEEIEIKSEPFEDDDMKLNSENFGDEDDDEHFQDDVDKEEEIAKYQEQIKKLESKIDKLETTPTKKMSSEDEMEQESKRKKEKAGVEDEETPKKTPKATQMPAKREMEMEMDMDMPTEKPKAKSTKTTKSKSEDEQADLVEAFGCGCDTNDRRSKLINYARADQVDPSLKGLFETFDNPPVKSSQQFKRTPNPFDVAGCRYDLKEDNPLHETVYGAPLASCQAYSKVNVAGSGTVFYPLNAF